MAEQRLIDAESLKHEVLEICKYNCFTVIKPTSEQCNGCEVYDIYKKIIEAPTVEAKPVVHAHWLKRDIDHTWNRCSACGDNSHYPSNYCPNCGAQMDEKENDNAP